MQPEHRKTTNLADRTGSAKKPLPRLIAWELTRTCAMACRHCRASAGPGPYEGELSTQECFRLLDNIASVARPVMILTGGEPMSRRDLREIVSHATQLGLRVVMATCGEALDDVAARGLVAAGVRAMAISLDGAEAETHDAFRGASGAFDSAVRGLRAAMRAGASVQVNTTVTADNVAELPAILDRAAALGAETFNPFLLVPTGRGAGLADRALPAEQYERILHWLARQQSRRDIRIRVTCAPHYQRIVRQMGLPAAVDRREKGCMGGKSFAFISHRGVVQTCGFLDVSAGDLRACGLDFRHVWETSELFRQVRDLSCYRGRCGRCEYAPACGGCRARAYAATGDWLAEEPLCAYQPRRRAKAKKLDETDQKILATIQADFPVQPQPFDALAARLDANANEIIERVRRMCSSGLIRRIGPVFDSRRLGYVTTLAAARVADGRLAEVAAAVSAIPAVTHNYRREHEYNLWFTLTQHSRDEIGETLAWLRRSTGIDEFHDLPATAVYKIRAVFPMGTGGDSAASADSRPIPRGDGEPLDARQKRLVRAIQAGLGVSERPFDEIASRCDFAVDRVIRQVRGWLACGVVRRFGAVVNHRRVGFEANGLLVFRVADDALDRAGRTVAESRSVSHCYARRPRPGFDYNLYAMVHAKRREEVRRIAASLAEAIAAPDGWDVLFSTEEYKKSPIRYFA